MKRIVLLAVLILPVMTSHVYASGEESCELTCPDGQVLVSFADGNNRRCICREEGGSMAAVEEQNVECIDENDDGVCE